MRTRSQRQERPRSSVLSPRSMPMSCRSCSTRPKHGSSSSSDQVRPSGCCVPGRGRRRRARRCRCLCAALRGPRRPVRSRPSRAPGRWVRANSLSGWLLRCAAARPVRRRLRFSPLGQRLLDDLVGGRLVLGEADEDVGHDAADQRPRHAVGHHLVVGVAEDAACERHLLVVVELELGELLVGHGDAGGAERGGLDEAGEPEAALGVHLDPVGLAGIGVGLGRGVELDDAVVEECGEVASHGCRLPFWSETTESRRTRPEW
jgi:hypothetical protein